MKFYTVMTGPHTHLETLSQPEAEECGRKVHQQTGGIPDIWEKDAPQRDHRRGSMQGTAR